MLRWYLRRARHQPQPDGEHPAAQHTSSREESHPESLTRAAAAATTYGTIEHVTPMPAPMTSPGADAPFEDVGRPAPVPPNPELAAAEDVARAAAEDEARPGEDPIGSPVLTLDTEANASVGAHVGIEAEGPHAVTHYFESNYPGYVGWRWAVTVASVGPGEPVTVSEVVLLPGPDALTAPDWVPWNQRVRPGDLGAGDLLPTTADDPRLAPGYLTSDDPAVEEVAHEVGLGRKRVLSLEGRLEAADRWHSGDFGPGADIAKLAPGACGTCGFFLKLAGSMGGAFGVCANELAPADGRVVSVEFGCGAHSEVEVDTSSTVPVAEVVYDDATLDFEPRG
ncbi:DUF3027 domain-containing protein [Saccharopolyspora sp. NPDC050389]|uniref:DUF3027 domain-containing protein n=1 Tax=Saccharopolyspora sp. NPDC050389 TaxID=3155516 RepID=UPI0033E4AC8E